MAERGDEIRHQWREREFESPRGVSHLEAITAHVEANIGPVATVLHEIVSDLIHLDVLVVEPDPEADRMWWTLVTCGMSDLPMSPPEGDDSPRHAELVITIRLDHPFCREDQEDEASYWPIRGLKNLARMPHEYESWLAPGHTVGGDTNEPVAEGVPFVAFGVTEMLEPGMRRLTVQRGSDAIAAPNATDAIEIAFYQLIALYPDELEEKRSSAPGWLDREFDDAFLRAHANDRPSLGPESSFRAMIPRGERWVQVICVVVFLTSVASIVAAWADGLDLRLGRMGFMIALLGFTWQGSRIARWLAVILLTAGTVSGIIALARHGLDSWVLIALAPSTAIWLAAAGMLALHPAVRMWFLMMREAKRIEKAGDAAADDAS